MGIGNNTAIRKCLLGEASEDEIEAQLPLCFAIVANAGFDWIQLEYENYEALKWLLKNIR